jgi:superfamily II DNA helicase RecQ
VLNSCKAYARTPRALKRQTIGRVDWDAVCAEASRCFGVTHFRPGQRELIECVLKGDDALGILPTGAGKSLCYYPPSVIPDRRHSGGVPLSE